MGNLRIEKVHIKGFRNYDDATFFFQKKTLIIGANDVGKTNLIHALRLLFDKTISEHDLELTDSDYNAYSGSDTIEITVSLCDITEKCLLSEFAGDVKDGKVVIKYTNCKDDSYHIFCGYNEDTLSEQPTRYYIKRLNMQCVDTNRNLHTFLNRERGRLLQLAKEQLSPEASAVDAGIVASIQDNLSNINAQINSLQYISKSLEQVNQELGKLSIHNEDQSICFVAGESDADKLLNNLTLSYSAGENPLSIGGDGRNNQVFLATWIAKQKIQASVDHVTFYAIEEPEAHLHPHQQRKLSAYIQENFEDQILITTHSPQIVSKFDPANIIRLYSENKYTYAACGGCSPIVKEIFHNFGYRLNALSSETFFSNGVFLVEGPSEVLFYTALSQELKIDLDRYNISILSVNGIGFKPYVAICNALNIPWVLRTDNDIFLKPTIAPTKKYYAGISRAMGILQSIGADINGIQKYWNEHLEENEWSKSQSCVPKVSQELNTYIREAIAPLGIFLSDIDLENDLAHSSLQSVLLKHYNKRKIRTLVDAMQKKKAENMLDFLEKNQDQLALLCEDKIATPLKQLAKTVAERTKPNVGESSN